MQRKGPRYYGKDERPGPTRLELSKGSIMSNNPDARRNGIDSRNGDIVIKDAEGNVKKVIKNKAQFRQGSKAWETVGRVR